MDTPLLQTRVCYVPVIFLRPLPYGPHGTSIIYKINVFIFILFYFIYFVLFFTWGRIHKTVLSPSIVSEQ